MRRIAAALKGVGLMRLDPECVSCLVKRQIENFPADAPDGRKLGYMRELLRTVADGSERLSAPEIMCGIYDLQESFFGMKQDYTEIKRYFNGLMMGFEQELLASALGAADPLKAAVQYAMTGNYIDFAAVEKVDEEKLRAMLKSAGDIEIDASALGGLRGELKDAARLAYLTDNCGEIVMDKLLISVIRELFPALNITVIVRGEPTVNDATMEDARQTGLDGLVRVIGNGSAVAGTCLGLISREAADIIDAADVVISKGQGNFETLRGCGRNIYYIFMCKCAMFAGRFGVPLYSGMLVNERRI